MLERSEEARSPSAGVYRPPVLPLTAPLPGVVPGGALRGCPQRCDIGSAAAYPTMMQERCDASSRHINVLGRARLDPGSRAPHDHVWREYSCVSVEYREHVIIFDVGSGLRQLGLYLLARDTPPITGSLFLTHTHWDHIQPMVLGYYRPIVLID